MKKLIREPLLHFMLIGAVLFGISWMVKNKQTSTEPLTDRTITIDNAVVKKIEENYQQHSGTPPTTPVLNELIQQYIRKEVLYKEALRSGLDRNNDSVKTLLAAQMNAAYQLAFDADNIPDPTDEQLVQFLREEHDIAIDQPIADTLSAVQTFLKTKLRFKYFQAEKQKHFDEKMKAIEALYRVVREDSFQTKAN